jgi:hypothetical protein
MRLLAEYDVNLDGLHAVVIGRSRCRSATWRRSPPSPGSITWSP